jgi:hypothetical protein
MKIIYDIETYPNCFTFGCEIVDLPFSFVFEISEYKNQAEELLEFLANVTEMIGFNNVGFDYPVLHLLIQTGGRVNAGDLYNRAMNIINSQDNDRWKYQVYPSDRYRPQIDLFKIHHFDNKAKSTSLKMLEFNMRMESIEELPFPVGQKLNPRKIVKLKQYNLHDVKATKQFYIESLPMIEFRRQLTLKYGKDFMNHNDVKIGTDFFQMQLEKQGVQLYEYSNSGRTPRQTRRSSIKLGDCILPWIKFNSPEFNGILTYLRSQTIVDTKGVFKDLNAVVKGFKFVFGLGGLHGSVDPCLIESDDVYQIYDLDVASYYPNLAITQNFYPEHLGEKFCHVYKNLYDQRKEYAKGTPENAMLKLALNGTYGQSNSEFSVFHDPKFTMSITLNGQLLLCMLAESLMRIPDLTLVQANTDGLTIRCRREHMVHVSTVKKWWEDVTKLELEGVEYSRMAIRDVNNYIAQYTSGKTKRKGAYEYELDWHQNQSALVVPICAEQVLMKGVSIRQAVMSHANILDFMLRTKVPRKSKLVTFDGEADQEVQNITRFIVTKEGKELIKLMPPTPTMLKEGNEKWRRIGIVSKRKVTICNELSVDNLLDIDYGYYINEVEKLVLSIC